MSTEHKCGICGVQLDQPGLPETRGFGGDCAECMARAGDGAGVDTLMEEIRRLRGYQDFHGLLPCPFCGGECDPEGWLGERDGQRFRGPECNDCGATAESVEAWNRRALVAVPDRLEPSDWFESSEQKLSEQRYCDGWNACREAMLAPAPPAPQAKPQPPDRWVVVRQTALDVGAGADVRTGGRPELGYALIADAGTFGSEEEARAAHRAADLPLGWVVMPLSHLLPDLYSNAQAKSRLLSDDQHEQMMKGRSTLDYGRAVERHYGVTGGDERRHIICLCPDCVKPKPTTLQTLHEFVRRTASLLSEAQVELRCTAAGTLLIGVRYYEGNVRHGYQQGFTESQLSEPYSDTSWWGQLEEISRQYKE